MEERQRMKSTGKAHCLRETLALTEEALACLEDDRFEDLPPILERRRGLVGAVMAGEDGHAGPDVAAMWLQRIRRCEDRCIELASRMRDEIGRQILANANKIKLSNSYGR